MTIRYTCKSCGREFSAHSDDGCPQDWLAVLTPMLTCNRCYDYHTGMSALRSAARSVAALLNHAKLTLAPNSERAKDKAESARQHFTRITKAIAKIVCRFHNKPEMWEPDFVEFLMAEPSKYEFIITKYVEMVEAHKTTYLNR